MTNSLAITLGIIILLLIAVDVTAFDSRHLLFLGKKLFDLIEWMAFWR
ncbi:hypothetical protein [Phaeobacter sp. HF9A]|nr:hypothetical protein [Phaeobacter sp. HF9A]NIZ13540.1 hypothetical protein [Phaeobacter sp. HF9A]